MVDAEGQAKPQSRRGALARAFHHDDGLTFMQPRDFDGDERHGKQWMWMWAKMVQTYIQRART